ncbi:MAG: hypothetical protein RLY80_33, partial [Actinomycetota bacterium]
MLKIFQRMARQLLRGLKMSNWPKWLPLREQLRPLTPYGAPQVPAAARLNTNENPYGPSKKLAAAIAKRIEEISENFRLKIFGLQTVVMKFCNQFSWLSEAIKLLALCLHIPC